MKKIFEILKLNNFLFNLNFLVVFLIIVNLFLRILKEFSSVDNIYMMINFFFLNQDYFIEDIFLKHSILVKNDYYYKLLSFFKVNIDNDIHGFFLHFFLNITSCLFIYLTIKKIFLKFSFQTNIFIILILAAGKSSFLLDGVMSNWLISHSSTPTAFSSTLNFVFIYFLVNKSISGIVISSILSFLISAKVGWLPLGISILYLLFLERQKKKLISLIPVSIFLIIAFKNFNFNSFGETNLELYEFSFNREFYATMFTKQSILRLIIFIISFPVFYIINKNIIAKDKQPIFNLILFSQVLCFFFFIFIESINFDFFKKWQFIALSPVRATALYESIFKLVLLIFIFDYLVNLKKNLYIPFIILAIYFVKFGHQGNYLFFLFFILAVTIYLSQNFIRMNIKKNYIILICIILISPSSVYLFFKDFNKTITFNFFNYEKRIFLKTLKEEKYYALKKFQHCKDFLFYDTTGNFYADANDNNMDISHIKNWSSNSIIKKSSFFIETAFLYGNLDLLKLNQVNFDLITQVYNLIKLNKKINIDVINKFHDKKLVLFINNKDENLFKNIYSTLYINEFYTLVLINYKETDFLNNCKT